MQEYDWYTVSFLGTVTWARIAALYGRNTALFVIITVRISVPENTDRFVGPYCSTWVL